MLELLYLGALMTRFAYLLSSFQLFFHVMGPINVSSSRVHKC